MALWRPLWRTAPGALTLHTLWVPLSGTGKLRHSQRKTWGRDKRCRPWGGKVSVFWKPATGERTQVGQGNVRRGVNSIWSKSIERYTKQSELADLCYFPGHANNVLVSSGCYDKVPQAEWLKEQKLISQYLSCFEFHLCNFWGECSAYLFNR